MSKTKRESAKWGIRKLDISKFNYSELEDTFFGIHNISVPIEMLDLENPDEILANYFSAGYAKRYNRHRLGDWPTSFLDLVNLMNRVAYQTGGIRNISQSCEKRFPSKPGAQRERLSTLDSAVGNAFVESFRTDYIPSKQEDPANPDAFYDPNVDGRSKRIYVDRIYQFLKNKESR